MFNRLKCFILFILFLCCSFCYSQIKVATLSGPSSVPFAFFADKIDSEQLQIPNYEKEAEIKSEITTEIKNKSIIETEENSVKNSFNVEFCSSLEKLMNLLKTEQIDICAVPVVVLPDMLNYLDFAYSCIGVFETSSFYVLSSDKKVKKITDFLGKSINVYGNIYFGKPENDNKITPETISGILSRLDIVEDLCGDANNQISKFRFDEDGNLLIDGFIKDLIGINPSTNQVLSWNGSDLEWVNCTGIDSNNFKKKVSITQRQWNLETINGAPVYCFDIPHGFTLTESSFIDAICYTDDNIRLFLSYKVDNNSVVIYSPTPINYNIHVIIKLI